MYNQEGVTFTERKGAKTMHLQIKHGSLTHKKKQRKFTHINSAIDQYYHVIIEYGGIYLLCQGRVKRIGTVIVNALYENLLLLF